MIDWSKRFIKLAQHIATWSKDPSTKVGAVIVEPKTRHVLGMGYNGFPRGVHDLDERYADRSIKYEMVVHAEVNAILNAVKDVRGCVLYCTFMPCPQCAAQLIQAGIECVYACVNPADERWKAKFDITLKMLTEAKVQVYTVHPDGRRITP